MRLVPSRLPAQRAPRLQPPNPHPNPAASPSAASIENLRGMALASAQPPPADPDSQDGGPLPVWMRSVHRRPRQVLPDTQPDDPAPAAAKGTKRKGRAAAPRQKAAGCSKCRGRGCAVCRARADHTMQAEQGGGSASDNSGDENEAPTQGWATPPAAKRSRAEVPAVRQTRGNPWAAAAAAAIVRGASAQQPRPLKQLFDGLVFLVTGTQKPIQWLANRLVCIPGEGDAKKQAMRLIDSHGGRIREHPPPPPAAPSTTATRRRSSASGGGRPVDVVIADAQHRTPKFLYACVKVRAVAFPVRRTCTRRCIHPQ